MVKFACDQDEGADIPIHFNPRLDQGKVVLNTSQAGKWGKEESHDLPFQKGERFEVVFTVTKEEYQVGTCNRGLWVMSVQVPLCFSLLPNSPFVWNAPQMHLIPNLIPSRCIGIDAQVSPHLASTGIGKFILLSEAVAKWN